VKRIREPGVNDRKLASTLKGSNFWIKSGFKIRIPASRIDYDYDYDYEHEHEHEAEHKDLNRAKATVPRLGGPGVVVIYFFDRLQAPDELFLSHLPHFPAASPHDSLSIMNSRISIITNERRELPICYNMSPDHFSVSKSR